MVTEFNCVRTINPDKYTLCIKNK